MYDREVIKFIRNNFNLYNNDDYFLYMHPNLTIGCDEILSRYGITIGD